MCVMSVMSLDLQGLLCCLCGLQQLGCPRQGVSVMSWAQSRNQPSRTLHHPRRGCLQIGPMGSSTVGSDGPACSTCLAHRLQ